MGLVAFRLLVDSIGQDQYGVYVLATSMLGYFTLLGMGMPGAMLKYIADAKARNDVDEMGRLASTAITFYLFIGAIVAVTLIGIALFGLSLFEIRPQDIDTARRVLIMTGVWSLLSWPMQVYGQVLKGLQEFHRHNLGALAQTFFINATYIALALIAAPVEMLVIVLALSQLLQLALNRISLQRLEPDLQIKLGHSTSQTFRKIFAFSIWMIFISLSGLVIQETDQTLLGIFVSTASITMYTVLATPLMVIRQMNSLVISAVLPAVAEAATAKDDNFVTELLIRGSRLNLLVINGLLVSAIVMAEPALYVWMGAEYAANAAMCQLLLLTYSIGVPFVVVANSIIGKGDVKAISLLGLITAAINLAISVILVQKYGLLGVILGTTISYIIMAPVNAVIFFKILKQPFMPFLTRVMAPVYATNWLLGTAVWFGLVQLLGGEPRLIPTIIVLFAGSLIIIAGSFLLAIPSEEKKKLLAVFSGSITSIRGQKL